MKSFTAAWAASIFLRPALVVRCMLVDTSMTTTTSARFTRSVHASLTSTGR